MTAKLDIALQLQRGEFHLDARFTAPGNGITAIHGASGAGKSSLLRAIAGLAPSMGHVRIGNETWQDQSHCLATHKRQVGMVFQDASLLAHLSVRGNLEFGWHRNGAGQDPAGFNHIVELLKLEKLLDRKSHELSGGEQQRVAIGRALLSNPKLLLMDEPLSSLDVQHKRELMNYLEQLHQELRLPVLYVSHSADEIARLADHLVLLRDGVAIANGPAADIMTRLDLPLSADDEAATFIETDCTAYDTEFGLSSLQFSGGTLLLPGDHRHTPRQRLRILARDVSLSLQHQSGTSILNIVSVRVTEIAPAGLSQCLVRLSCGDNILLARITRKSATILELHEGLQLYAQIKAAALLG